MKLVTGSLLGKWTPSPVHPDDHRIKMAFLYQVWGCEKCNIYQYSNGYGEQGYIPTQGYDWSGIRDSSNEAITEMVDAAVKCGHA